MPGEKESFLLPFPSSWKRRRSLRLLPMKVTETSGSRGEENEWKEKKNENTNSHKFLNNELEGIQETKERKSSMWDTKYRETSNMKSSSRMFNFACLHRLAKNRISRLLLRKKRENQVSLEPVGVDLCMNCTRLEKHHRRIRCVFWLRHWNSIKSLSLPSLSFLGTPFLAALTLMLVKQEGLFLRTAKNTSCHLSRLPSSSTGRRYCSLEGKRK